jgi:hypothetical protein
MTNVGPDPEYTPLPPEYTPLPPVFNLGIYNIPPIHTYHTTEQVDGVNFVVTLVYDKAGKLASKQMIREDLVRG